MKLQRPQIVAAALQLLDESGLEGVTMRRLADALGVQAATLYYHLADKSELFDWMAQAMLSPVLTQLQTDMPPSTWSEWLAARAQLLRQALLAHRDGARVVAGARLDRTVALAAMSDETIRGLTLAGFPVSLARLATKTVFSYLVGFVIEEQALAEAYGESESKLPELPPFPALKAAVEEAKRTGHDQQEDFDDGLEVFLAGIRAWSSR